MHRHLWSPKSGNGKKKRAHNSLRLESLESRQLLAADLVSLSPADDASNVAVESNLVLTFSDDVKPGPGAGRLLIMNAADDSVVEAVDVSDAARVTFSGHTVTVDPAKALPADAKLYISVDPGAIRDLSTSKADGVLFSENFETTHLLDSSLDAPSLDNYTVVMTGKLDVQTAGDYRFGGRSDDGQWMAIDLNKDGKADIYDPEDIVIFDDTTHGLTDKFSETAITLAKGEYLFEYGYFEGGGGSAGEAFYAPDPTGDLVAFDAAKFAVIGDASKGIGVTVDKIKATTYASAAGVGNIQTALDLRDGNLEVVEGFPVSGTIDTADVWNSAGKGYYTQDNEVPGNPPIPADPIPDYAPDMPFGWSKQTNLPQSEPAYNGWTQLDKDFWIAQQGDQSRALWELGQGTVAVMDPDAFDDFSTINDGVEPEHNLEAYTTLPAIDLTDVTANTIKLDFDSSFRPESQSNTNEEHPEWIGQTGLIDVSFDGGATWTNVLYKNSETEGGDGSTEHCNEHLTVDIANPTGGTLLIRLGIANAQNNWWWAVDNIVVTGNSVGDLYQGIANDRAAWSFTTASAPVVTPGDINADGKVDLTDFGILKSNFGKSPATVAEGDTNGDAKVDLTDFGVLKANFGKAAAAPAPVVTAQATDYVFALAALSASSTEAEADPFAEDSLTDWN